MAELSSGVKTLIARMESNPEEFYGEAQKWRFIFRENFREVLTEPEKGALHEALKGVRRKEFDVLVVKVLLEDDMKEQLIKGNAVYPGGGLGQTLTSPLMYAEREERVAKTSNTLTLGNFK